MTAKPRAFANGALPASVIIAAISSLALAGCGGEAPTHGNGPRGLFTSTNDCSNTEKFNFELCSKAITSAIKVHNDHAPTYDSERICESKERSCERTLNDQYRPRLLGFYVELPEKGAEGSKEPTAKPLYAAVRGEKGFRANDNTIYLETDLSLEFSRNAVAAYKAYSGGAMKGGFGT
ncbi:MAG: hypothetical protein APF80_15775 [Alphaproteobacteria bacterium BRH_c36]|nr:MAG: hypothetical protein APF80_15775 [Alphaproteobacteria bacterium BRH_c36]